MITTAIINLGYLVLNFIIGLFTVEQIFPESAHEAVAGLGGYLGIWSPILPISTLAYLVGIVTIVEISIWSFKTIKWIASHIPFVGGRG